MNITQAKQINLVSFLQSKGFNPEKTNTKEAWYLSPFRNEKKASFKVDIRSNKWHDFGAGESGNIVDLVVKIYSCSVSSALEIISDEKCDLIMVNKSASRSAVVDKDYSIKEIKALKNELLLEYIIDRKIDIDIAKRYLKEIVFELKEKKYFALCFENKSKGHEIRNKYFKGSFGKKDITIIETGQGRRNNIAVFEGFFNLLAALTYYKKYDLSILHNYDYLVLNGICNARTGWNHILNKEYEKVCLYLDNDNPGKETYKLIKEALSKDIIVKDKSPQYEGFNDFNEFIIHLL
jgi:hypothetical protein